MDENKEVNTTDPKREKVRVIPLSAIDDAPEGEATPSLAQAIQMKKLSQAGVLTEERIEAILSEEKPNVECVDESGNILKTQKYTGKDDYCGCTRFASSYRSLSDVQQRCFAGACRQNSIYVLRQNPTEM